MAERRESVKVTADVSNFTTRLAAAGASAQAFARDLDSADSRMGNLVQTGLALGPALVPIGAVAIPAITALSAGLGVAVLGAGSAILAFQGIGDALTAANAYAIDPSVANLEKLQEKLHAIGPAGRDMVVFLQDLKPELDHLKGLAGEGLFPGLQDGIDSMLNSLPQVEALISSISASVGDVAAGAGAGFDSPFWRDFLDFLTHNSRTTMQDFADATGNVAQSMASLWMAFDPLNDDFTGALVSSTQALADWSAGLSQTTGFQDFTDYLRTSGPQVVDTLASLGNALVQLLEAAAPLGGPTLAIIRAIADTLSAIAASPVGPILIGTAAGLSAVSRAVALYKVTSGSALVGFLGGASREGTRAAGGMRLAAAGVGVLALSLTDVDEKLNATGKLTGAALGATFGPLGAAVGLVAGSFYDAAHANDALNDALDKTIQQGQVALDKNPLDFALQDDVKQKLLDNRNAVVAFSEAVGMGGLGDEVEKSQAALDAFIRTQQNMKDGLAEVANEMRGHGEAKVYSNDLEALKTTATNITPALDSMGLSLLDIRRIQEQRSSQDPSGVVGFLGDMEFSVLIAGINGFTAAADTAQGRTLSVASAMADLGAAGTTAAQGAENLKTALDNLLGPELDVSAANDAWMAGLQHLNDDLAKNTDNLFANTDAGRTNRAAIRDRVNLLTEDLTANARAGMGAAQLTRRLKDQRQALLDAGVAAGISRGDLRSYLNTLGLTPKLVKTIVENTAKQAQVDAQDYKRAGLDSIPASLTTRIDVNTSGAYAKLSAIQSYLAGLHDKTITVNVNTGAIGHIKDGGLIGASYFDAGGPVFGPGGPRDDRVPAWLSNGEFVVNAAAARRHLGLLFDINAQKFADGGPTAAQARQQAQQDQQTVNQALRGFNPTADMTAREVRQALHELEQTLRGVLGHDSPVVKRVEELGKHLVAATARQDKMQNALEDLTGGLQDLRQERNQFRSEVRGSINNDIFGLGLAGLNLQLRADTNDNTKMAHFLRRAEAHGLSGGLFEALSASGDIATAQEFAGLNRRQIAREERLFNARARAQGDLGQFAANAAFGPDIREQTNAVHRMEHRIDHMSDVIDHRVGGIEHAVERGSHSGNARRARSASSRRKSRRT